MKRILTTAVTPDMYKNIWRKHGCIPDNDADLLNAVREAGIEEEELARALVLRVDWGTERLIAQRMVYHERKGICENNRGVEYGTV